MPDISSLFSIGLATMLAVLFWYSRMSRALGRRRRRPKTAQLLHYPSVTVIRPVRGADVGAEENVAAALDTGYPGDVETIFVFDDDGDPGLPLVHQAIARHEANGGRGRAEVVIAGAPPAGVTG